MACRFSSLYRKHVLSPHSLARCVDINVWCVASAPYTASKYYHLTLLLEVRILMYGVSLQPFIPQAWELAEAAVEWNLLCILWFRWVSTRNLWPINELSGGYFKHTHARSCRFLLIIYLGRYPNILKNRWGTYRFQSKWN